MRRQALFWYVHAMVGGREVGLAVSARTEASARREARRQIGPDAVIIGVDAVEFSHAWVIDHSWTPRRYAEQKAAK